MCLNLYIFLNTQEITSNQHSLLLEPRDSVFLLHVSTFFISNITKTSPFYSLNISGFLFHAHGSCPYCDHYFGIVDSLIDFLVPQDYLFFLSSILLPDYSFLNQTFLLSSILPWKLPNNSLSPGCTLNARLPQYNSTVYR